MSTGAPRWRRGALAVAVVTVALAVFLFAGPAGAAKIAVDDAATLLSALTAAVACVLAARRSTDATRRAWALLAAGLFLWAVGEGIWAFYEVVLARDVPLPSIADAAYLAAVLPAAIGILSFPGGPQRGMARTRALLDGCLVTAALLFVVWAVVLGDLWRASIEAPLGQAITLLYPATDVVLASLAVMAIVRGPAARRHAVALVAAGVSAMAVADVVYGWLANRDAYQSGSVLDAVWIAAYLALALAAVHPDATVPSRRADDADADTASAGIVAPYVPVVAAAVACVVRVIDGRPLGTFLSVTGAVCLALLVVRQFTALVDNVRLTSRLQTTVRDLEASRAELRHLAYHDPLTGLPNRALFFATLESDAVAGAPVAVLYADLDRFKQVNDSLGHAAGDELLVEVAMRLTGVIGTRGIVARLGGDEFGVVVHDPDAVAHADGLARVVDAALRCPVVIQGERVVPSASIGVATADGPAGAGAAPDELVRWADAAMYAAKATRRDREGGGQATAVASTATASA
jgi:diguanylate cyclase (GGDEF)-like protein